MRIFFGGGGGEAFGFLRQGVLGPQQVSSFAFNVRRKQHTCMKLLGYTGVWAHLSPTGRGWRTLGMWLCLTFLSIRQRKSRTKTHFRPPGKGEQEGLGLAKLR